MMKLVTTIAVSVMLCLSLSKTSGAQEFDSLPSQTLLYSGVANITVVDSFFVSAGPGGISVFTFDADVQKFDFTNFAHLDIDSVTVKRFDTKLFIKQDLYTLYVMDLAVLPEVAIIDTILFPHAVADFEIAGSYFYTAAYFDGIQQYYYDGIAPVMSDSSMKGVLVTDILLENDTLYAVDEYNGLMRYDVSGSDLGNYLDYIYSSSRLFSVRKEADNLYLLRLQGGMYIADASLSGISAIVDSVTDISYMRDLIITGDKLLAVSQRFINVYEKQSLAFIRQISTPDNLHDGDFFTISSELVLLLPDTKGGISVVSVDNVSDPYQGLVHASEIHEMLIYDNKLIISGPNEPVKVFAIDDTGYVSFEFSIYEDIKNSTDMVHNGDSLLVLYPELDRVAVYLNSTTPESLYLDLAFSVGASTVNDLYIHDFPINDMKHLLVQNSNSVDVYAMSDSGYVQYQNTWNFIGYVYTVNAIDSFLFVSTSKSQMLTYKINNDYSLTFLNDYSLNSDIFSSVEVNKSVYLFENNAVFKYTVYDTLGVVADSVTELQNAVREVRFENGKLYSAEFDGISVYGLQNNVPELLQHDGFPANTIAVSDKIIAASNGNGLVVYRITAPPADSVEGSNEPYADLVSLSQNYPNPFNAATVIQFSLSQPRQVKLEIFNILGRKVSEPVNSRFEAGIHEVEWDGTNSSGHPVATGVYFYRISSETFLQTKKMVLLK